MFGLFKHVPWYSRVLPKTPIGFFLAGVCLGVGELAIPLIGTALKKGTEKVRVRIQAKRDAKASETELRAES